LAIAWSSWIRYVRFVLRGVASGAELRQERGYGRSRRFGKI